MTVMAINRGFSCGFRDCSDKLWHPRDLAEVRLERECRLGLTVDDAIKVIRGQSQRRMALWPKTDNGDANLYWTSTAFNVVLREACVF